MADVRRLTAIDRWFTYPKFLESAGYAAERLKEVGAADARVIRFRADGKTLYGAWRAPMAWDARSARLSVVEPPELAGAILCDYESVPCSLVMWSGPTPKGGVTAEVVVVNGGSREEDYTGIDVRGKIVLTDERASHAKGLAARRGAVGILTDWHNAAETTPDARFWNNTFNDAPAAWGPAASDSRIFGFCISPNQGRRLRTVLSAGKTLKLHAFADTRLYAGPLPVATGSLPGKVAGEQVLVLGHGFEQGAKDNASGAGCMIEALRVINRLVREEVLPRPRRSIRMLLTNECFGTLGYVARFPSQVRHTVAGLCLDGPGIDQVSQGSVQGLFVNPHSNASYLDTFAERLGELVWSDDRLNPHRMQRYAMTDNLIAHPGIGIPTVWMGSAGDRTSWHSTIDTPDRLGEEQLEHAAAYTACYLYFLACAETPQAVWLAELAAAAARDEFERRTLSAMEDADSLRQDPFGFRRRMEHLADVRARAVTGAMRLVRPADRRKAQVVIDRLVGEVRSVAQARIEDFETRAVAQPPPQPTRHPEGDRIVPVSNFVGPITYDPIPLQERKGYADPRWGGAANVALEWADGKRTLNRIVELTENEMGRRLSGLGDEMLFLMERGMVSDASQTRGTR